MDLNVKLEEKLTDVLTEFPWTVQISDWRGNSYRLGKGQPHWYGRPLEIHIGTAAAGKDALAGNGLRFLERFLDKEVELEGNLYLLNWLRKYLPLELSRSQYLLARLRNSLFQTPGRSSVNVKSHYDVPHEVLELYLDKIYRSYSCAFFERPSEREIGPLITPGTGMQDNFDSLEKAQWRKFHDAIEFVAPAEGDTLLDVGCGHGGQLAVALQSASFAKVVGWTWSDNETRMGREALARFDPKMWELNHGDYRFETRRFDHITSTGMVSHVGPRGLSPYVKRVRALIRTGGRYVHHALMNVTSDTPLDAEVGAVFNKKYIWPGFHWFTLDAHIRALEENGFIVRRVTDYTEHYGKTLVAWYERFMDKEDIAREHLGEKTFRAWRLYLAGGASATDARTGRICRLYCTAV